MARARVVLVLAKIRSNGVREKSAARRVPQVESLRLVQH